MKDVEGLARYCKELLTKRQIDTMTRSQTEQQLHRLQQDNSGLGGLLTHDRSDPPALPGLPFV